MGRLREGQHQPPHKGTCHYKSSSFLKFNRKEYADKYFFILGNGPSITPFIKENRDILGAYNVVVIGTNVIELIYRPTYLAVLGRFSFRYVRHITNPEKVICFIPNFEECVVEAEKIYKKNYVAFPTKRTRRSGFSIDKKGTIECPSRTVGIFALNCGILMGGRKFILVGFDGKAKMPGKETHFYANRNTRPREIDHNTEQCFEEINKYLKSVGGWMQIVGETKHDKWWKREWRFWFGR